MCGRYASTRSADDLAEEFEVVEQVLAAPVEPDWNVAPTKSVPAVVVRPPRDRDDDGDHGPARTGPSRARRARCGSSAR